jgi:hypothetical protein
MMFAQENEYDPFNIHRNVETDRLPIPAQDKSPQLTFYKVSNDDLFTSYKGNSFHVIDNELLLVYQYDYENSDNPELVAVKVPDEIGNYFIELLRET